MVNVKTVEPPALGKALGYSHGMRAGNLLFVAGQIGGMPREDGRHDVVGGFVEQFEKALHNVVTVVQEAGGDAQNVVEMTVYVTDMQAYRTARDAIGKAWRRVMGKHFPAMTLVSVPELFEPEALVELRAVAALNPEMDLDTTGEVC
jgi:enamine deaminase RidA (YjgF/YER057c/UK114 family)